MRIDNAEQALRNLGELIVDLQVNPGSEEGKTLEQPLDVRVVAAVGLQLQTCGDFGMLLGKLRSHLPQEAQFALVVFQKIIAHATNP